MHTERRKKKMKRKNQHTSRKATQVTSFGCIYIRIYLYIYLYILDYCCYNTVDIDITLGITKLLLIANAFGCVNINRWQLEPDSINYVLFSYYQHPLGIQSVITNIFPINFNQCPDICSSHTPSPFQLSSAFIHQMSGKKREMGICLFHEITNNNDKRQFIFSA